MKLLTFNRNSTFKLIAKLKEDAEREEKLQQQRQQLHLPPLKSKHSLELIILIYATVRYWSVSAMMYFDYRLPMWKIDYYARWVYDFRGNFDPFGPLMFWLWTVLIFAVSRSLKRLHLQRFTFNFFYQTVVGNRQAYERCLYEPDQVEKIVAKRKKKILQEAKKSALFWIVFGDGERSVFVQQAASWYSWATLESVNQQRFSLLKQARLDCMPTLNVFWRCQVARVGIFVDGAMFYILPFATLLSISFCVPFLIAGRNLHFPFGLVAVQIFLENMIIIASVIRLARYAALLVLVTPIITFIFPRHLRKVYKFIRTELSRRNSSFKAQALCHLFLREQYFLTEVIGKTNAQFFSSVLLGIMAVFLPNNIYFVSYFFYRYQSPLFRTFLVVAIVCTFASPIGMVMVATTTECLLAPVHFLPEVQMKLKGVQSKGLKMKLDGLMAALCNGTGNGLTFTIGPLANITVGNIYEFAGFYIGYLLFAFGNFMQ